MWRFPLRICAPTPARKTGARSPLYNSTQRLSSLARKKMYGTKAANLSFLRNKQVLGIAAQGSSLSNEFSYDIPAHGFGSARFPLLVDELAHSEIGIPFQFYLDTIHHPDNAVLLEKIYALQAEHLRGEVYPVVNAQYSRDLRALSHTATIPPHVLQSIREVAKHVFRDRGVKEIKFRSSSNAEDLPGFDGAGLYDSFPVDLDLVRSRLVAPVIVSDDR